MCPHVLKGYQTPWRWTAGSGVRWAAASSSLLLLVPARQGMLNCYAATTFRSTAKTSTQQPHEDLARCEVAVTTVADVITSVVPTEALAFASLALAAAAPIVSSVVSSVISAVIVTTVIPAVIPAVVTAVISPIIPSATIIPVIATVPAAATSAALQRDVHCSHLAFAIVVLRVETDLVPFAQAPAPL